MKNFGYFDTASCKNYFSNVTIFFNKKQNELTKTFFGQSSTLVPINVPTIQDLFKQDFAVHLVAILL